MANERSLAFSVVKIALVVLNSLVIFSLAFLFLVTGRSLESTVIFVMIAFAAVFFASIIGALKEHRLTVITTGTILLIKLIMAVFICSFTSINKSRYSYAYSYEASVNDNTFSFLFFLAIVILSYVYAAMLRARQLNAALGATLQPNAGQMTTIVVYQPPDSLHTQASPFIDPNDHIKGPPPPYYYPLPPKYEESEETNQTQIVINS